ncbi:MAG: sigma 54-interacting transcriptional regulator [Candidatus Hydrogenedentes bacterium]|nr:sigma 54-interacting transcriptional regulator [Candidatus Hydrogenedentota bacterium]
MRPTKLSSKVFLELPPALAHYLEAPRNQWLESTPNRGRMTLLNRTGVFTDLESLAVERRHLLELLGHDRARALCYRVGFEQGRRDGARHYALYTENARLALQAGPVFGQLQGWYAAEPIKFEFDLEARTLYREILLYGCIEALAYRMAVDDTEHCACWLTAGRISGHTSELVGRRVITVEAECSARGAAACKFISRLDPEWGKEADWCRDALRIRTVDEELAQKDELLSNAQKAARRAQSALNDLNRKLRSELMLDNLVADSDTMQPVAHRAQQIAASDSPALIVGEPGTGRQAWARAIHFGGMRKHKPFIIFDCLGLTGSLLMQELLGFEKDAFPGAVRSHAGALARAHGGTLYLNEINRLREDAQGIMLQCMRDNCFTPLGAPEPVKVDVRIIAATQQDPQESVESGALREDLFYALSVGRIDLPPLRERGLDVSRLAELFLQEATQRFNRPDRTLSTELKRALQECAWPGNIRQLRHVIEHAVIMAQDRELGTQHLPDEILVTRVERPAEELTAHVIRAALRRTHNNRSRAADLLGVGRTTLWRAMKRLGLE